MTGCDPKKALVLVSGGQDSATCLAIAIEAFGGQNVQALAFDYGQRHVIELEQSRALCTLAGIALEIMPLDFLRHLSPNALTDFNQPITVSDTDVPSTFVPGRNLFFLSVAGVVANRDGMADIYTGVCQTDYSGYPDCRQDFVNSINQSINLALNAELRVHAPLMWLTKAQTVQRMVALGKLEWYAHTHTCYEGLRPACGQCPSCILRRKGFDEAGIQDPLDYER